MKNIDLLRYFNVYSDLCIEVKRNFLFQSSNFSIWYLKSADRIL